MAKRKAAKKTAVKKKPTNNKSEPMAGPTTMNEFTLNELHQREQILNAMLISRGGLAASMEGDNRDINSECGYPESNELTVDKYYRPYYDRHAIAARVVEIMPEECWRVSPEVFETEDQNSQTEFEKDWEELSSHLTGSSSFIGREGNPIWEYMKRVDTLSGIGSFGVMLLGLDDGGSLEEEVIPRKGMQLTFVRCFDEGSIQIGREEQDSTNPRYGKPIEYKITFSNFSDVSSSQTVQSTGKEVSVHWSRIIHVADNVGSNECFGVPRMRPVFNHLWDLKKIYGGSGEGYWKGAFPGLSIESHPSLGANVSVDETSIKTAVQKYQNSLQRYLTLTGMSAKSLAPQVVDPSPIAETHIDAICIKGGYPKRIFIGSERGELSSSQDAGAWNERLAMRHNKYLTPRLIVPFVDRLIQFGVLSEPKEYHCVWPDLEAQSGIEKATIADKQIQALAKYVAGNVDMIIAPMDLLTRVIGFTQKEAKAIVSEAMDFQEGVEDEALEIEIESARKLGEQKK